MIWRRRSRIFLHLLLALLLVIPGVVAPMQGVASGLADLAAVPTRLADTPCDMHDARAMDAMPCDCCTPHDCDLTACLGVSCLPEVAYLTALALPAGEPILWDTPPVRSLAVDTPLRPPRA